MIGPDSSTSLKYDNEVNAIVAASLHTNDKWWHGVYDFLQRNMKAPKLFLLTSLISCVCMVGFSLALRHGDEWCIIFSPTSKCCDCLFLNSTAVDYSMRNNADYYYTTVMVVSSCFAAYHAIRGVMKENKFHLLCYVCSMVIFLVRASYIMFKEGLGDSKDALLPFLSIGLLTTVLSLLLTYPTFKQFGWRLFRKSGAKRHIRQMYKSYERFMAFVRLDMEFNTLVLMLSAFYQRRERLLIVCNFIVTAYAWNIFVLRKAAQHEMKKPFMLWFVCWMLTPIWWAMTWADYENCYDNFEQSRKAYQYNSTRFVPPSYVGLECLPPDVQYDTYVHEAYVVVFINAFIFRVVCLVNGIVVYRNFGRGLKEHLEAIEMNQGRDSNNPLEESLSSTKEPN